MNIITQINKAVEFVKNKEYKAAEKIYQDVYKTNPQNPVLLTLMGYLYLSTKKYKKAEFLFESAWSLSHSQSACTGLATIKYMLGKYNEAIPLLINLIKK